MERNFYAFAKKTSSSLVFLLHVVLILSVLTASTIPFAGVSASSVDQRFEKVVDQPETIDTGSNALRPIDSSNQPKAHPEFHLSHSYGQVTTPDYYYANQVLQASETGIPCLGLGGATGCKGKVEWYSAGSAVGPQDGGDAKIINSSHYNSNTGEGLRACMVVLLDGSVHVEHGAVQAYVHQSQTITQDMGMRLSVADGVLSCGSPDWTTVANYQEVGGSGSGGPGWYGNPNYTGDIKAIRIEVWSNGGNGFCYERDFYIDSVRVYGIPYEVWAQLERSTRSGNLPKNGPGDPRECAVSACRDAQASAGDPVDTRTGNFDYSLVDLSLQTVAGPLRFQRSYASQALDTTLYPTDISPGWTHNQDVRLFFDNGLVWFKGHTINQYQFADNGNQSYTPYAGVLANLSYDSGANSYILTSADQSTYTFGGDGVLQTWRNAQGFGFDYTYIDGKLYRVTEPISGQYIQFNYQDGRLFSVNDPTGRQVSFGYQNGDLTSFTDVQSKTWTYAYEDHRLTILKDPVAKSILTNVYDTQGRVYEQFNGKNQRIIKLIFNNDRTTTLLDALDRQAVDTYDARGVRISQKDAAGYTTYYEYDDNFRLVRVADQDQNSVLYTWSANGANLTDIQDAGGYTTHLVYDTSNRLTSATDPRSQVIEYTYNGALLDYTTRHTTEWGDIVTDYEYTTAADAPQPAGLLKAITDDDGHVTLLSYDSIGQLVTIRDAASIENVHNESHLAYDAYGWATEVTDPMGRVTHYEYDPAGNPRKVILNYAPGQPQDSQNQFNLTTEFVYDDQGRMTQVKGYLTETQAIPATVIYDDAGRIYQTLDAYGKAITYTYLATGQIQTITDPLNHAATYIYDETLKTGRLFQVKDAAGRVVQTYTYNLDGTVATVTMPTVHTSTDTHDYVVTYQYDALRRVKAVSDNNSHVASASYDGYGNPLTQTDALGRVTKYSYNELGLLASVTQNFNQSLTPDQETNVLTTYTYNALGWLTGVTDANNHATHYEYDPLGRLRFVTDARNKVTEYGYDPNGNRTSIQDANGFTTILEYDLVNRLHTIDYPGGTSPEVLFWYDALGRMTGMDDSLGHTSWVYDDLNRITSVTDPFDKTVGYGYDDAGNLTNLIYPGERAITYQYNAVNQLEHVLEGTKHWADYSYDTYSGRLTSSNLPNGLQSNYTFDYSGQLTGLNHRRGSTTLASYGYQYNAVGNRIQAIENLVLDEVPPTPTPRPTPTPTPTPTPKRDYLPFVCKGCGEIGGDGSSALLPGEAGQSDSESQTDPNGYPAPGDLSIESQPSDPAASEENEGTLPTGDFYGEENPTPDSGAYPPPEEDPIPEASLSFWDRVVIFFSNLFQPILASLSTASHTGSNELVRPNGAAFSTMVGTTRSVQIDYQYDALNRLLHANVSDGTSYHYIYDPVGNRTSQTINGVTTGYQYDEANRLTYQDGIAFTWDDNGNLINDGSATYTYDYANRLTGVTRGQDNFAFQYDGLGNRYQQTANGLTTTYVLDQISGLPQVLADGTYTYFYGLDRLAQQSATQVGYFLPDALGSVRQMAGGNGYISTSQSFDPFGSPIQQMGQGSGFGYAGEQTDDTGLQYLRARYYDPGQGRFLNRDPFPGLLDNPSTLNAYAYVTNNPILMSDPSGQIAPFLFAAGLGGLIGAGMNVFSQLHQIRPQSFEQAIRCLDWGQVGISFAAGAVAGLVGFTIFGGMTALLGTGLWSNIASGAVAGAISGQYDRLTELTLSGQASQIGNALFRPEDLLMDSFLGGAFAGVGYGLGKLMRSVGAKLAAKGVSCINSFSADTDVTTKDGEKPIQEINIGDLVLAFDEEDQETGYYPVTGLISHQDTTVVYLTIDSETLTTTLEHPFFDLEEGWRKVGDLRVGDRIRKADGNYGQVLKIEVINKPQWMFNLTVDQAHTFFVGDEEWLVHNACNWLGGSSSFDSIGNNHVNQAEAYLRSLPRNLRRVTIGVTEINGTRYVSINGGASPDAISRLGQIIGNQPRSRFVVGNGFGPEGHAERALYNMFSSVENLQIGISRVAGPCPECINFFGDLNFTGLFWPNN